VPLTLCTTLLTTPFQVWTAPNGVPGLHTTLATKDTDALRLPYIFKNKKSEYIQ